MAISKVEKFDKLVALATSPNVHEALAAARLALEMIRPGGPLRVVEHEVRPGEPGWELTTSGRVAIAYATELLAKRKPPKKGGKLDSTMLADARDAGWIYFAEAKFGGRCVANCGKRVEAGEPVFWKRGEGILCVTCLVEQAEQGELV